MRPISVLYVKILGPREVDLIRVRKYVGVNASRYLWRIHEPKVAKLLVRGESTYKVYEHMFSFLEIDSSLWSVLNRDRISDNFTAESECGG
jgi:hypothetical protein